MPSDSISEARSRTRYSVFSGGGGHIAERSNAHAGRLAGLAYLAVFVFSASGYITLSKLLAGDSHAVLSRLVANQAMFTLAFVASVIGFSAWVVLAVLLYRLMSSAGRLSGALMLLFAVAGTAMSFIALSPLIPLIRSTSGGIEAGTLAPMVASYNRLLLLAQVFSGLWLLPFGWLLIRSGIAPRFLGFCLIIGGVSYLMNFATAFAPDLNHLIAYRIVGIATGVLGVFVGELGICLWLLLKGAHDPKVDRAT